MKNNNNLGVSCSTYMAAILIVVLMLIFGSCGNVPDHYYARGMNVYLPDSARVEYIMPLLDQNKDASHLGVYISKKWPREKRVYDIYFTDGDDDIIAKTMGDWHKAITTKTGIQFVRTMNRAVANMAISFTANNQAWSYVGTDCDYLAKTRVTMNLGWHIRYRENQGGERYGTGVHEMMHGLGYVHTLQDPACAGTLIWNKEYVYAKYLREQGWDMAMVDAQVFTMYPSSVISHNGCDFKSVMCYPVGSGEANVVVGRNNEMSPLDDAKLIADYKEVIVPPTDTIKPPAPGEYVLVTKGKPAIQSSSSFWPASNVNNGIYTDFNHTLREQMPWIKIDMGAEYNLTCVKIYNRAGCSQCVGRLRNFKVLISNHDGVLWPESDVVFKYTAIVKDGEIFDLAVNKKGRYLILSADNTNNPSIGFLHLAEIEGYTWKGTVIDPPKPVCKDTVYKVPVWTQTMRDSVGRVCR